MRNWIYLILLMLCSCSPGSIKDCRFEANGVVKDLVADLRKISSKDDLIKYSRPIQKKFSKLVDLMIVAQKYSHGELEDQEIISMDDQLLLEMKRLYQIDGIKEEMENLQRDSLLRLDSFDLSEKKKSNQYR